MELNINDIKKILPHRYPFLMVDKVIELKEGVSGVGIKNVSANENFFQGHFPDMPIMPGVLMVEALAQMAGIVCTKGMKEDKVGVFTGIKDCKFRKRVIPGDVLKLEVEIISFRRGIGKAKGVASVDGELACKAELSFALIDK